MKNTFPKKFMLYKNEKHYYGSGGGGGSENERIV
jgi:hypothetical protein